MESILATSRHGAVGARGRGTVLALKSIGLAAAIALGGCAVKEPPLRAQLVMPEAWTEGASPNSAPVTRQWWLGFNSAQLVALIQEASTSSTDIRIASERIRQAEITLNLAGVSLLPNVSAGLGLSTSRSDASNSPASSRRGTNASLSISYELDVWGRIAAGIEGAQASLGASRYDLESVRITVLTSVASTYFQLLAAEARTAIARENLATAERVLRIVDARYRNGVATPLEVSQQTTTVLSQRTALIPLEVQQRQLRSALALLVGRMPQNSAFGISEQLTQLAVPRISPDLPSTLLVRRPDLASAEAQLQAADANIAAARAAVLPGFSLSASGGVSSAALLTLANPASTLSLGLGLSQSIFDNGRQRLLVDSARSQRLVLIDIYERSVRTALKEVDDGLGNAARNERQEETQREVLAQAQRSLRLAELRYREGAGDLLSVLDAQRTLFTAQDQLAQLRLARLAASLDLFKALGGGWADGVR